MDQSHSDVPDNEDAASRSSSQKCELGASDATATKPETELHPAEEVTIQQEKIDSLIPSPFSLPVTIQRCIDFQVKLNIEETDNEDDIAKFSSLDERVRTNNEAIGENIITTESESEQDKSKASPPSTSTTINTEFVLQRFVDRTFLLVSQMQGRIGTYLMCRMEHSIIDNSTTFNVQVLLGKRDDTVVEVLARQIHERFFKFESQSFDGTATGITSIPPLMLGITLDRQNGYKRDSFQQIVDTAVQMYRESCGE